MSKHQELRAVIKKMSGQDNMITVPRIFIEFLEGDLNTALILNQLVFYSDKTKRTDGFFYKNYDEWEAETGLTRRKIKGSIDKLIKKELVTTKLKKANGAPTLHYALDYDKMLDSIMTKCANPSEQNVSNPDSDKMSDSLTDDLQLRTTDDLNSSSRRHAPESGAETPNEEPILEVHPEEPKPKSETDEQKEAVGRVFQFYDNNFGGTMTNYHRERLGDWCDDLEPEIVLRALETTILQGGNNLKYVDRILNDWHRANCRTIADVEKHEDAKKQQRQRQHSNKEVNKHARYGQHQQADTSPPKLDVSKRRRV